MTKAFTVVSTTLRIVLTLFLTYGVFTETGIWTALAIFLIFASLEFLNLTILSEYSWVTKSYLNHLRR